MNGKGRNALPNTIKKMRGTDQPVRMKNELQVDKITEIKPPVWLKNRFAKKIFKEKSELLIKQQLLSAFDIEQLALYSNSMALTIIAMKELNNSDGLYVEVTNQKTGAVSLVPDPHLKIYNDALAQVNKIGSEFGFSPVSRQKINAPKDDKGKGDEIDDWVM